VSETWWGVLQKDSGHLIEVTRPRERARAYAKWAERAYPERGPFVVRRLGIVVIPPGYTATVQGDLQAEDERPGRRKKGARRG